MENFTVLDPESKNCGEIAVLDLENKNCGESYCIRPRQQEL